MSSCSGWAACYGLEPRRTRWLVAFFARLIVSNCCLSPCKYQAITVYGDGDLFQIGIPLRLNSFCSLVLSCLRCTLRTEINADRVWSDLQRETCKERFTVLALANKFVAFFPENIFSLKVRVFLYALLAYITHWSKLHCLSKLSALCVECEKGCAFVETMWQAA